jgi:hypothetical protein
MKRGFKFLFFFTCMFISCKSNNKDKIIISSRYQDYKIDETNAKEEVVRNIDYEFGISHKNIPIDSTSVLPNPMIDAIHDGEYMVLLYRSSGCFHQYTKSIVLKKSGSKIYGILPGQLVVELTSEQIDHLKKFESLLNQVNKNSSFCTTVKSYKFYLGKRLRSYIDDTCGDNLEPFDAIVTNLTLMGIPIE